jgi:hemolysin activation/secretion protein
MNKKCFRSRYACAARLPFLVGMACCVFLLSTQIALAEVTPDAGRILQDTQQLNQPKPVPDTLPPIQAPATKAPPLAVSGDMKVNVTQFTFNGNDAISTETLQEAVAKWSQRSLDFGELMQVVEAVEAHYKAAGYFLAQAYLPPQKIKDGSIEITISEGKLGEFRLEGESRVDAEVIFKYLDRLPKGEAVTMPPVERQILLINELAGGQATLDFQAGEAPGTTDIALNQKPEALITGRVDISNHGSPSTGKKRAGLNLNANSPLNLGDRLSANIMGTDTGNLSSYNLRYELPVGGDGLHISAAASLAEYSLGGSFASLGASGQARSLRLGASYPLVRSRADNLKFQLEMDSSLLNDSFSSTSQEKGKRGRGLTATFSGDSVDEFLGGGSNRAELAFRHGMIYMNSTSTAEDAPPGGPGAIGNFDKANLTLNRQQAIAPGLSAQLQLTYQLSGKNLDSSEKMSMGGPTTLPGYANGESSGDSGGQVKLNLRWQAHKDVAVSVFADYAKLRLAHTPLAANVNTNHKRLSDYGLSADLTIVGGLTASAILAWAHKDPPNATDNARPRFWLNMAYGW